VRIFIERSSSSNGESSRQDFSTLINLRNIIKCHNFSCFNESWEDWLISYC